MLHKLKIEILFKAKYLLKLLNALLALMIKIDSVVASRKHQRNACEADLDPFFVNLLAKV